MTVARHYPLSCLAGTAALLGTQQWNWSPMLRKRELGVLFSAVFLYFLLALVCAVIHDTTGRARRQAGWQDGRHPGSHNDTPITMYPGMALLLHVSWFVLTSDCAFPNDRSLDACMYHPIIVSPHPGKHVLSLLQAAVSPNLHGQACMGPSRRRLRIDPDWVACSRKHCFDVNLAAGLRGCLAWISTPLGRRFC